MPPSIAGIAFARAPKFAFESAENFANAAAFGRFRRHHHPMTLFENLTHEKKTANI